MRIAARVLTLAFPGLLVACGGGSGSSEIAPGDPVAGAEQFEMHCATCHPNGEAETGPALRNRHFAPAHVRIWVRQGSESMNAIPPEQLSDADLHDIIAYLVTLGAVKE